MQALPTSPSGSRVPPLLYGTAWKRERTAELVELALQLGYWGIDTACQPKHYDEAAVGAAVAAHQRRGASREQLYLQTKFTPLPGQDPKRVPYDPSASLDEQVRQSCAASLKNLQTSYLDCLILHSPLRHFDDTLQVWQAMEALVDSRLVRALGISNCYDVTTLESLWRTARVKPLMVQNRFYAETGYDREIRAFCSQHAAHYQSFWTLTANPTLLREPPFVSIAQRHAVTPEQLMFRCLTQWDIIPLTGTTSPTHMREDLAIFDFELSPRELQQLDEVFA